MNWQTLVADNPAQIENIEELRTQVNRAIANMHERIAARQAGGIEAVLPMVGLEGKEDMDQMRFTIAAMSKRENTLRNRRTSESERECAPHEKQLPAAGRAGRGAARRILLPDPARPG